MPHLYVAVSGHGFGHFAQVVPLLDTLDKRIPGLRLTLQTAVPEQVLRRRLRPDFTLLPEAPDVTMAMHGPTEIDWPRTVAAYQAFHRRWPQRLVRATERLASLAPDLVLADVPYLPLAAAQRAGIPNVALCSLNWADILAHHPPARQALSEPLQVMRETYANADAFMQPAPAMPMSWLHNRVPVGPIAAAGRVRRDELRGSLGLAGGTNLILVGLGGIPGGGRPQRWLHRPGWHWLLPSHWVDPTRPDQHAWEQLDWPFTDLLHSCDLVITKPGYGTFVEAACAGIPVLYAERHGWAETPWLEAWLARHQPCMAIPLQRLLDGDIETAIERLLAAPRRPAITPTGVGEAGSWLAERLAQ